MTGYVRKFNKNATMSFIVKDKQLLKNYSKIWKKVEQWMKIDFESKPVYSDNYKNKNKNIRRQRNYKFSWQKNA